MSLREKIIKIWLTFVLTFIGLSKVLIIIPFILQIKIGNTLLVNFIDFIFKLADYVSGKLFISTIILGFPIFFTVVFLNIIKFLLFAAESYILVTLFMFLFKSKAIRNLLEDLFSRIAVKFRRSKAEIYNAGVYDYNSEQKSNRYGTLLIIGFILIFTIGGYLALKNYYASKTTPAVAPEGIKNGKNVENIAQIKILPPGECNLPDKIGNYILKDFRYAVIKPEDVKFHLKGAVSKTGISYTAPPYIPYEVPGSGRLYEIPYFEAEITITSFDNSKNVSIAIEDFKNRYKFRDCEIGKIKGLCPSVKKIYSTGKDGYEAGAEFIWQDFDMLKVIKLQGGDKNEDFSEKEKKALDDLALLVPVIKNCKIENK